MNRLGGTLEGGVESRNVVEVPNDRRASPGAERDMTVAGLSPVNGAIMHSGWDVKLEDLLRYVRFAHLD